MSSSPADPHRTGEGPAPRRAWSLTTRLALLSSLSSFVILALISLHLYLVLADHLHTQNRLYLFDQAETLAGMARFPGFPVALAREMYIDHAGEEYLSHYLRLVGREGGKVIESPGMEIILPSAVFPRPSPDGKPRSEVVVRGQYGSAFIATALRIDTGEPDGEPGVLQVALDVTNVEKVLAGYRYRLAGALLAGFLLCVAGGLAVARRGTRPLKEITKKAREITTASLDERLVGANWPTELNALAGALNGMLDRLQDSFRRLDISVANLTHKLRTPLTILRGEAEVALGRERTAEELREIIESSLVEYERVAILVDNIVLIAQAESGRLQSVPIKIEARAEIEKVLDFYEPLAEEKGIAVTCEGNASLTVDPTLFRKAVAKLISNALTYSPDGGRAVISVRQGDDRSVEVSVADSGFGIAEQEIPRLFDRFYRVYATRYTDPLGSGLGLPIVKTIMNLHNGSIEVKSQPAEGTTVVLRFPPPA